MEFITIGPLTVPLILASIGVCVFFVRKLQTQRAQFESVDAQLHSMKNFRGTSYQSRYLRQLVLIIFMTCMMIVMLLRPVLGTEPTEAQASSLDIVVSLDSSLSMNVEDFGDSKSRLEGGKSIILSLLDKRPVERFSLVTFAAKAYTECPLTNDKETIKNAIDTVITNSFYTGGTAVVAGLKEGVARLTTQKDATASTRKKVLILLTDGENVQASTEELGSVLTPIQSNGIQLIVVGIGTTQGGKIPYAQYKDGTKMYIYQKGGYAISKLDEKFLRQITSQTNGKYIHATSLSAADEINDALQSSTQFSTQQIENVRYKETYYIFAALMVIALVIYHLSLYDVVTITRQKTI